MRILVKAQDCFQCHSDHHGRKFDMIRFDEDNFDHELTGYELEGNHETVDCRKCHVSENIADSKINKGKKRIWVWMKPAYPAMMIIIKRLWQATVLTAMIWKPLNRLPNLTMTKPIFS